LAEKLPPENIWHKRRFSSSGFAGGRIAGTKCEIVRLYASELIDNSYIFLTPDSAVSNIGKHRAGMMEYSRGWLAEVAVHTITTSRFILATQLAVTD